MRHHYVPQFLLNAWGKTSSDGKVEVFRLDIEGIPSSRRGAKYTGYEKDLYALSVSEVGGMEKQAIETQFLRHVDDLAAQVRLKLDEEGLSSLSLDELTSWVRFLMSLRIRQPELVSQLKEEAAILFREKLGEKPEEYQAEASSTDPPTLEEWAELHFPGIVENIGLSFFAGLVDNDEVGNKILGMKWWIRNVSSAPYDLLLSDSPCIFTAGIEDPDLIIAMPIAPSKAFFATRSRKVADGLRSASPKEIAMRLNESSLSQARVRIYARNASQGRFIRNRKLRVDGSHKN